jgi:type VI secretion system protein ImpM
MPELLRRMFNPSGNSRARSRSPSPPASGGRGSENGSGLAEAAIGFHGKIPARGDFVQTGLPRSFVAPWDAWTQRMLTASRAALGESWAAAWRETAVWRFVLSPGICGPGSVLGLFLPSVDRVGRYYPLTLAAVSASVSAAALMEAGDGFLDAAECAGRDALAQDLLPQTLAARLAAAASAPPSSGSPRAGARGAGDPGVGPGRCPEAGALWWTAGAPRVPAGAFATAALPDETAFVAMLDSARLER